MIKLKVLPSEKLSDRPDIIRSIISKAVQEHSLNKVDQKLEFLKPINTRLLLTMPRRVERDSPPLKK